MLISSFFYLGFDVIASFINNGDIEILIENLSINYHYQSLSKGVIDSRDLVYFISINIFFILLSKNVLINRKFLEKNLNNLFINLILLILINLISTLLYFRIDLTEDKKYSISSTSKNIINEIDDVMYIKIYLEGDFPSGFKRLQNSTIDLLNQLKKHNQLIKYELINPNIKNIEERNNLYKQLYEVGLNPNNLQTQNSGTKTEQIIFPGAIIYYKGKSKICVNLLQSQFGTHHVKY